MQRGGSSLAQAESMRSTFLILLLSLGLGGVLLVKSRQTDDSANPNTTAGPQTPRTGATPRPKVSDHNWPKNSLDRVGDLKHQVAQQRKENDAN